MAMLTNPVASFGYNAGDECINGSGIDYQYGDSELRYEHAAAMNTKVAAMTEEIAPRMSTRKSCSGSSAITQGPSDNELASQLTLRQPLAENAAFLSPNWLSSSVRVVQLKKRNAAA